MCRDDSPAHLSRRAVKCRRRAYNLSFRPVKRWKADERKDSSEMAFKWTNPSVLQLAGNSDPVQAIQVAARNMVLSAVENGWTGPPFDPFDLAAILNLRLVPSQEVVD